MSDATETDMLKKNLEVIMKELSQQLDEFRPASQLWYFALMLLVGVAVAVVALASTVQGTASNIAAGVSTSFVTVGLFGVPIFYRDRRLRRLEAMERSIWLAAQRSWYLSGGDPSINFEAEYFAVTGRGVFGNADMKELNPFM
jgi:uncharacterized membrane protein